MAVTIAVRKNINAGNSRRRIVDITGPASYTTGGETLSQSDLNVLCGAPGSKIGDITMFDSEDSTGGHALVLDRTNSKVMYFNGTTQIGNAVNLSAIVARAEVVTTVNG